MKAKRYLFKGSLLLYRRDVVGEAIDAQVALPHGRVINYFNSPKCFYYTGLKYFGKWCKVEYMARKDGSYPSKVKVL